MAAAANIKPGPKAYLNVEVSFSEGITRMLYKTRVDYNENIENHP